MDYEIELVVEDDGACSTECVFEYDGIECHSQPFGYGWRLDWQDEDGKQVYPYPGIPSNKCPLFGLKGVSKRFRLVAIEEKKVSENEQGLDKA